MNRENIDNEVTLLIFLVANPKEYITIRTNYVPKHYIQVEVRSIGFIC